jgi:cytochrome c biogenesis protein CcmG/thiol:disulfide interchange protein DsbE
MKTKIALSFLVPLFILVIFYLALNTNNRYSPKNLIGNKIESFRLNSLNKNMLISSDALTQNSYSLINFWASWCPPCRKEHQFLMLLQSESQIKILGINFKDKKSNALTFLKELGDPYNYSASDPEGRTSIKLGIYGIPESILIDKDLKIIKKYIGPIGNQEYKEIIKIIK